MYLSLPKLVRRLAWGSLGMVVSSAVLSLSCVIATFALTNQCAGDETAYPVWTPNVEFTQVFPASPPGREKWGYNHDADITRFRGRYIVLWNGNPTSWFENRDGQYNFLSYSDDFRNWSDPVRPFTSDAHATPPVDSDQQWQPSIINLDDRELLVGWQGNFKQWLSRSTDGLKWTNRQLPARPNGDAVKQNGTAFPSVHGLRTARGTLLIPLSIRRDQRHAFAMISNDDGETWHFSEPIVSAPLRELGVDPQTVAGEENYFLWEPVFYQKDAETIGCLVRNQMKRLEWKQLEYGRVPLFGDYPNHHMVLQSESRDEGQTWTPAVPVQLITTSSRPYAVATAEGGMAAVLNDWVPRRPHHIEDRHNLALYLSPTGDPDLLLPGPLVQPTGAQAHYPSGELSADRSLALAYSLGSNPRRGIWASRLKLPALDSPFFMPRGGWGPAVEISKDVAKFPARSSALPLVLTRRLTEADAIRLTFNYSLRVLDKSHPSTILTIGGTQSHGMTLTADASEGVMLRTTGRDAVRITAATLGTTHRVTIDIRRDDFAVITDDQPPHRNKLALDRKICFGGLYVLPADHPTPNWFEISLPSVRVETQP